jgi:cytochrome c-type biogenesis protein CcmH
MRRVALAALAALSLAAAAQDAEEERFRRLAEKLRCLVCQNQSLAESGAELAGDLRRELREQVKAGRSDEQILDFMVARYGDFVLYEPPLKATTLLLWAGPFALLAAALGAIAWVVRRRRPAGAEPELGEEERRRLERSLGAPGEPK